MDQFQEEQTYGDKEMKEMMKKVQIEGFEAFARNWNQEDILSEITFMLIDIDYYTFNSLQGVQEPKLRMFGITEKGNTILCEVNNFLPYFYIPFSKKFQIKDIKKSLTQLILLSNKKTNIQSVYVQIEVVQKQDLKFYKGENCLQNFIKIILRVPAHVAILRNKIQRGITIGGRQYPYNKTYQSAMPFALRFLIDKQIVGMGWVHVKNFRQKQQKIGHSQIYIEIDQKDISAISPVEEWSKIAPLRILSFDIQCNCKEGFPVQQKNQVIQIACVCKNTNGQELRVIFVLKDCCGIPGVFIKQYKFEKDLLLDFQKFVTAYDPDIVIGYNMINFDFRYLFGRARQLKIKNYGKFNRINKCSGIKEGKYLSKAMGMRDTKQIDMLGRIQLDLMIHMHKQFKLSSYTLNNVCSDYLKEQKQDVHYSQISKLYQTSPETRKRLAKYCQKDAQLPLKLFEKLMCLYNYTEMARVSGVTINLLIIRGQQIKVLSMLYRKAQKENMIIPCQRSNYNQNNDEVNYQGAHVFEPRAGFYKQPIATLDFSSLYPSIMIAHNLCYTTLIQKHQIVKYNLKPDDWTKNPETQTYFIKSNKKKGLLPQILNQLISARKKAKKQLAQEKDPFKKAVLDGRQLALKISANSVYGFTGAKVGQLPCLQISATITAFGRTMIQNTKKYVEQRYNINNGYQHNAEVIYGDTDSVMVKFGIADRRKTMQLGKEAAQYISAKFISPIKLEFEKVYHPFLLITKKRYAGLYFTKPQKHDKLDSKGLQSVRRDNCRLIRGMIERVLQLMFIKEDKEELINFIKKHIYDLLQNKIDLYQLVITKALTKNSEEQNDYQNKQQKKQTKSKTYKAKQAHVVLAEKMKQRNPSNAPHIGDRIPYVMIQGQKNSKNYDNAQDPIYVMNQNKCIDYTYYIQKQIRPPLERILKNYLSEKTLDDLFAGEHTKHRIIPKINKNLGLGKFVKVKKSCCICKIEINTGVICDICKVTKAGQYLFYKLQHKKQLEQMFAKQWNECQRCQGSFTQEVICSNSDCPIYFNRIKIRNQLKVMNQFFASIQ